MWFVKRDSNTGLQVIPTYKQDIKCNVKMEICKPKQPARTLYSLLLWNLKSDRKYQSTGEAQPLEPLFCKSPRPHILTTYIGWNTGSNVFQLLVETSYCFPGKLVTSLGWWKCDRVKGLEQWPPTFGGSKGHGLNWLAKPSPTPWFRRYLDPKNLPKRQNPSSYLEDHIGKQISQRRSWNRWLQTSRAEYSYLVP